MCSRYVLASPGPPWAGGGPSVRKNLGSFTADRYRSGCRAIAAWRAVVPALGAPAIKKSGSATATSPLSPGDDPTPHGLLFLGVSPQPPCCMLTPSGRLRVARVARVASRPLRLSEVRGSVLWQRRQRAAHDIWRRLGPWGRQRRR